MKENLSYLDCEHNGKKGSTTSDNVIVVPTKYHA